MQAPEAVRQDVDPEHPGFSYAEAFSRNIGWVTRDEQQVLRGKRVAIAGMGGVGGVHLLTLARLGIASFHIADFDHFGIANFNRQAGAMLSTVGQPKAEVLRRMALDINPEIEIRTFDEGVTPANLGAFLDGVDVYVDGLDFFAFAARQSTFTACHQRGIPAVTAAPLGMGTAVLSFLPGQMSFENYFGWADHPDEEKALRFLVGLAPAGLHGRYLVDPSAVNLAERRGPSSIMGCQLCAGVAATEVLKILLKRGDVICAPSGVHFDAYRNKLKKTWRPLGNRNPLQRLILAIGRRRYRGVSMSTSIHPARPVEAILNLARWAPSGDNAQNWRFEIASDSHVVVHGFDTRDHCIYDLQGHASWLALGALLETMSIAATAHGLRTLWQYRSDSPDTAPTFDVRFEPDASVTPSPLIPSITLRSVQRRPMKTRALTTAEKASLEAALGSDFRAVWFEGFGQRWRMARLMFRNAKLRLTLPEAFETHRRIIDWGQRFSETKVPEQALGAGAVTLKLMRFAMVSWKRVDFLNRFLAGTVAPRVEMDLVPSLACAAHVALIGRKTPKTVEDFVAVGGAVQRFWLTATQLGLSKQPGLTPLIFSEYLRNGVTFSAKPGAAASAEAIARHTRELLGDDAERAVWLARLGAGPASTSRSTRLPLDQLMKS